MHVTDVSPHYSLLFMFLINVSSVTRRRSCNPQSGVLNILYSEKVCDNG